MSSVRGISFSSLKSGDGDEASSNRGDKQEFELSTEAEILMCDEDATRGGVEISSSTSTKIPRS